MIHVVSTGLNAKTKGICLESVARQRGVAFRHHYVEAGEQNPPKDAITNMMSIIFDLPPDDIVVSLDGDDWLARRDALAIVADMHAKGAWVTFGSYKVSDGKPGIAAMPDWSKPIRSQDWVTTHLKTYRAGLFQRIRPEELHWPASEPVPWDMIAMFSAIEMAGPERCAFCPETLCVYNFTSSHEATTDAEGRKREIELAGKVRAFAPYDRIVSL